MSVSSVRVSLVVATYSPGDMINRLIESLDAQTLPAVGVRGHLRRRRLGRRHLRTAARVAAARPNVQVHRIPNSGWPSRPRNVGIEHARGEYVLFMDHDDSLYPDGLRRAYEYAAANDADV